MKLFLDKRLTMKEPHHVEHIQGRLAAMKIEDPARYEELSKFYGVNVDVKVEKQEKISEKPVTETIVTKIPKKSGRPKKS